MLLLTKIRLINWHFFENVTIDIKETTLFAGDNGSGKSTIIDAIQYALVANIRKIKFNAAALDKTTGRSLESYCRCKIGSDSLDYHREDTISHVMLEFENASDTFCAGIMVESFKDKSDNNEILWVFQDSEISDIEVFSENHLLKPRQFKDKLKNIGGIICASKRDYNSRLTHLLGVHRRNIDFNPYLEAVVRSVNFTPFSSVGDFVCNYILEERQVDISAMRENLINYKEAEKEAELIKKKISLLSDIEKKNNDLVQVKKQIVVQHCFKKRLDLEICRKEIAGNEAGLKESKSELSAVMESINSLEEQKERLESLKQELTAALLKNDEHALLMSLQNIERELNQKLDYEKSRFEKYNNLKAQCEKLSEKKLEDIPDNEIARFNAEQSEIQKEVSLLTIKIQEIKVELVDKKNELDELKRGFLRYPESTIKLKKELEGKGIQANVFADLLDITDDSWQNAVEGWLNTQRFNILVGEKDFQKALEIYNKMPKEIYGVGVPNLEKMHSSEIKPGSLSEIVTTSSPAARRYATYLLGDVIMSTVSTLRENKRSITKECMRYSGFTANRISEKVYSRWYIGKQAREKRMETLEKEISTLGTNLNNYEKELNEKNAGLNNIKNIISNLYEMKNLVTSKDRINELSKELGETQKRISQIDTSAFKELEVQLTSVSQQIKTNEEEVKKLVHKSGSLENDIKNFNILLSALKEKEKSLQSDYDSYYHTNIELSEDFEKYYNDKTRKESAAQLQARYESVIKGFETRLAGNRSELLKFQNKYNRDYNTYMPEQSDDSNEYIKLLKKLHDTELPSYQEKIQRARIDAEKQFKDHFVSRLNEYITEAKESFSEINHTLKVINFGQDQYRFSIEEEPGKRKLLNIIRTASQVAEDSGTLWEQLTSDEDRENIERLFNNILENDLDSIEVRELCDYRQYFQYDIKIKHTTTIDEKTGKPHVSSLSKVLREKSGGETQTPYYVAIAASFFRFYKDDPNAIRLVLFDEAFNKMDDDRIGNAIGFFKKLGMQVITAVPTEKIETIAPYMDKTNLVIRRNYSAVIRDYEVLSENAEQNLVTA